MIQVIGLNIYIYFMENYCDKDSYILKDTKQI